MSIWLIGGTKESAEIAEAIAPWQVSCVITVVTEAACQLYPCVPWFKVRVGRLLDAEIEGFLSDSKITAIVDASHPYATKISQGAIAAAIKSGIPYLRYERPELVRDESNPANLVSLDSVATLVAGDYLRGERVLLTLGCQTLALFRPWQDQAILFARVLPTVKSVAIATDAGFSNDRLIAIRPPITLEMEEALWRQWQISLVVTKASGEAGGEHIKCSVAAKLDIPLIIIRRPKVNYPQQTEDFAEVLTFIKYSSY